MAKVGFRERESAEREREKRMICAAKGNLWKSLDKPPHSPMQSIRI